MKVVFVVCTSDLLLLKDDQYCAYNIIGWDLKQTLAGKTVTPLRMLLLGEGGTGKSKVIQMVTEMFTQKALKFMHMKSTSTGIAASIIDGKMTHTIGCFSQKTSAVMSDKTKAKLQEFWRYIQYLVIDEVSMISKTFLALLSQNVGIGVAGSRPDQVNHSFGINMILCGDFHQFPPVAAPASEALYQPISTHDSTESQLGQKIYEEFMTIVCKGTLRLRRSLRLEGGIRRDKPKETPN